MSLDLRLSILFSSSVESTVMGDLDAVRLWEREARRALAVDRVGDAVREVERDRRGGS